MKTCTKCGQAIPDESKFCSFCGEVCQCAPAQPAAVAADTAKTENTADTTQGGDTYYAVPAQVPAQPETDTTTRAEEQKLLDSLSNRLKWERLAWKIPGIILLVCSILFLVIASISGITGIALMVSEEVMSDDSYYEDNYYDYYNDYYSDDFGDYYSDSSTSSEVMTVFGGMGMIYGVVYGILGFVFLPIAIVNLVMAKKVGKYRNKVYTDCTDAVNHATSVGSIVLAAFFSEYALIAIIINFILTKRDKAKFEKIAATQAQYNAQFPQN